MMQLYKIRDFGALISDTFTFFKENGKNYFKNYFILNGVLLILLVVLYVVGYKSIFGQILGSNINQSYYFEQYFQENALVLVLASILFLFLFLICTILIYSYPVLYLKRFAETKNPNISLNDIVDDLKKSVGKFFIFLLGMMFVILPLSFVLMGISALLIMILIGFLLIFFIFPFIVNVINFTLYDYYNTNRGFFSSFSYALRAQFGYSRGNLPSPFWKYWGSNIIMFIIIQVLMSVFSIVPMALMYGSILTVPDANKANAMGDFFNSSLGIAYFVFYGISMLASFILFNFISVNAGLMYYDSRTDLHQNENLSEIETIGNREN